MKIFDLEYLILSSVRHVRARVRKAFIKKQVSTYLFLRYLSIFIIAYNIFISNSPSLPKPQPAKANSGLVLSQETKADVPKIPTPRRILGSPDFEKLLGKSALVLDATTSAVLYEKGSSTKLPPASLTKMMTSLVVLDYKNLSDEVRISLDCTKSDGAKVGFSEGQTFTVESLLYALLLPSASDAACSLSTSLPLPGPEASPSARFINAMGKKALEIGLKGSAFTNPVGLDDGRIYSTAADLLTLSKKFMENTELQKIVNTVSKKITSLDGKASFNLKNTNELLLRESGFKGIKTGTTPNALGCLAFIYERDGHKVIGVVLGSPLTPQDGRFADAKNLVDWIFKSYEWK